MHLFKFSHIPFLFFLFNTKNKYQLSICKNEKISESSLKYQSEAAKCKMLFVSEPKEYYSIKAQTRDSEQLIKDTGNRCYMIQNTGLEGNISKLYSILTLMIA